MLKRFSVVIAVICCFGIQSFGYIPMVWMVDDDGGGSVFQTIQEGVDNCQPGDWVLVAPGIYSEMLTINTDHISIIATDLKNKPMMDNGGATVATNGCVWINANNVKIHGLNMRFGGGGTPHEIGIKVTGNNTELLSVGILGIGSAGTESIVGIKIMASDVIVDDLLMHYTGVSSINNVGVLMTNGSFSNNSVINSAINFPVGVQVGSGNSQTLLNNIAFKNNSQPPSLVAIQNAGQSVIKNCEISGFVTGIKFNNRYGVDVSGEITNNTISNADLYGVYCVAGPYSNGSYSSVEATLNGNVFTNCIDGIAGDGRINNPSQASVHIIIQNYSENDFVNCVNNTIEYENGGNNVYLEHQTTVGEWALGESYAVGDLASYDGVVYQCIQGHIVYAPNWIPPNTAALWVVY